IQTKQFYNLSTSLLYVDRKRNKNAFGSLIGSFNHDHQSERRTRSRFVFVQPAGGHWIRRKEALRAKRGRHGTQKLRNRRQ
ncbi:hypothetical protein SFRURICE_014221, partial [Spodoptera frugiperda]